MSYEGTLVKAPLASRRKIIPPTPQQSSHSSTEAVQSQTEVKDQESGSYEKELESQHLWNARDGTVIARMEEYLNKSDSIKVEIVELQSLLPAWSSRLGSEFEANLEVCESLKSSCRKD